MRTQSGDFNGFVAIHDFASAQHQYQRKSAVTLWWVCFSWRTLMLLRWLHTRTRTEAGGAMNVSSFAPISSQLGCGKTSCCAFSAEEGAVVAFGGDSAGSSFGAANVASPIQFLLHRTLQPSPSVHASFRHKEVERSVIDAGRGPTSSGVAGASRLRRGCRCAIPLHARTSLNEVVSKDGRCVQHLLGALGGTVLGMSLAWHLNGV